MRELTAELFSALTALGIIGLGFMILVGINANAQGIVQHPEPLLAKCDVDLSKSTPGHKRYICKNVLDFAPQNSGDYGNSKDDPKDPSNDPNRNHDER